MDDRSFMYADDGAQETQHHDSEKVDLSLLPLGPLVEVARVMDRATDSDYERFNWMHGTLWSRFFASTLRHVWAWWLGEDRDKKSGCHPLAHAVCDLLFLIDYQQRKVGTDDRPKLAVVPSFARNEPLSKP